MLLFRVCRCTFQRASENNNKKNPPKLRSAFHMFDFVLSSLCRSGSAPLSFMDSRAAGWVGRGRREDAAGDDGISLFDLI